MLKGIMVLVVVQFRLMFVFLSKSTMNRLTGLGKLPHLVDGTDLKGQ